MIKIIHKAFERGYANHGWLETRHSFSFAGWHNPEKIHFGVLRVLNDDIISPMSGFELHPHNDMEIITIPLEGQLTHTDSTGNSGKLQPGDVQVMSAGSGIFHSEFNRSNQYLKLLQIWLFPKIKSITPSYNQKKFDFNNAGHTLIASPDGENQSLIINQDAWIWMVNSNVGKEFHYKVRKNNNGLYIFVIDGILKVDEDILGNRDALGLNHVDRISFFAETQCRYLIFDIPMTI